MRDKTLTWQSGTYRFKLWPFRCHATPVKVVYKHRLCPPISGWHISQPAVHAGLGQRSRHPSNNITASINTYDMATMNRSLKNDFTSQNS